MYLKYLPLLAKRNAPRPPRELRRNEELAWHPLSGSLQEMCVALITSGAIREGSKQPFPRLGDASYRMVTSDPAVTDLHVDHRTRFGIYARKDPEVAFPRIALQALAGEGVIGRVAPFHFSIYGGIREYKEIEEKLAPELASRLIQEDVDLAVFLPF